MRRGVAVREGRVRQHPGLLPLRLPRRLHRSEVRGQRERVRLQSVLERRHLHRRQGWIQVHLHARSVERKLFSKILLHECISQICCISFKKWPFEHFFSSSFFIFPCTCSVDSTNEGTPFRCFTIVPRSHSSLTNKSTKKILQHDFS